MSNTILITGGIVVVIVAIQITRYLRDARRAQDTVTQAWFKEHEYRLGQRGYYDV